MKLNKMIANELGKIIDVKNVSSRNVRGAALSNQFILTFEHGSLFKSYDTFVAAIIDKAPCDKILYLNPNTRVNSVNGGTTNVYSSTTNRACIDFCGLNTAERRKAIKDGKYNYADNGMSYSKVIEINLNK